MKDFIRFAYLLLAIVYMVLMNCSTNIGIVCKDGFGMLFCLLMFGIMSYWIEKEKKE